MEHFVAHYRILERIGEGGMGMVFSAEDTRLARRVAIKLLPVRLFARTDLRLRLIREARTAARLNHPNICTVHDVGELERDTPLPVGTDEALVPAGSPYIVMELLRGDTLREFLLRTGPLPTKVLVSVAVQVANALAEAHAHGIVHRDLKPANVMVAPDGRVKILDFGLAKPLEDPGADDVTTAVATQSAEMTKLGHILGTVAYMSPEQARGQTVDSRSDVFTFGTMLYELATGQLPFQGETTVSTVAKILEAEPVPPSRIRQGCGVAFDRIIKRCLQKKPGDRYNDTRDLLLDLEELQQSTTRGGMFATTLLRSNARWWVASGIVVAVTALAAGGMFWVRSSVGKPAAVPPAYRQLTFVGDASHPAASPDGQFLAYVTGTPEDQNLIVHDLTGGRTLVVFRGRHIVDVRWSPDGATLAVPSLSASNFPLLNVVSRLGGPARVLPGLVGRVSWSPDSSEIAGVNAAEKKLHFVSAASGAIRSIALEAPFTFLAGIDWSPHGDGILLEASDGADRWTVWLIKPDGSGLRQVMEADAELFARWAPTGGAVYYLKGAATKDLWKLAISSGQPSGQSIQVLSGLEVASSFTIFRDGRRLAYPALSGYSNLWLGTVGDGTDQEIAGRPLTSGTRQVLDPSFSPDSTRIVHVQSDGETSNIFVLPAEGGPAQQITFMNSANRSPVWSPDGQTVAFVSNQGGTNKIWKVPASGGTAQLVGGSSLGGSGAIAWAPGRDILYQRSDNRNLFFVDGRGKESPLLSNDQLGWISRPIYSPTGNEVAVLWNRLAAPGLYVLPVSQPAIRQSRAQRLAGPPLVGLVGQHVVATPYRGKDLRLVLHARALGSADNGGQCWLRVDRPNRQVGFFDNMASRPIRSAAWNTYEIVGKADADADSIAFGCFFRGAGDFWLDDVDLSFKDVGGTWTSVAISNPGFEDLDSEGRLVGWGEPTPGYTLTGDRRNAYRGSASLRLAATAVPAGLFAPIGWSANERWVDAFELNDPRHILAIPVELGPSKRRLTLPLGDGRVTDSRMSPDGHHIVFTVANDRSDIRVITDFDPTRQDVR